MSWRSSIGVPIILSCLALSGGTGSASADEAYLCGPDKVVYVRADELEAKKHTDPCIASFYGLTVDQPAEPEKPTGNPQTTIVRAPPTFKKTVAAKAVAKPVRTVDLKRLEVPEVPSRQPRKFERAASLEPPAATPGTDYRNVRVINATSHADEWFRHSR